MNIKNSQLQELRELARQHRSILYEMALVCAFHEEVYQDIALMCTEEYKKELENYKNQLLGFSIFDLINYYNEEQGTERRLKIYLENAVRLLKENQIINSYDECQNELGIDDDTLEDLQVFIEMEDWE